MKPRPLKKNIPNGLEEIKAAVELAVKNGYEVVVTLKKEGRKFHIQSRKKEVVVK